MTLHPLADGDNPCETEGGPCALVGGALQECLSWAHRSFRPAQPPCGNSGVMLILEEYMLALCGMTVCLESLSMPAYVSTWSI